MMIRKEDSALTTLFNEFFSSEKAGGLILVFATILSLILSNSPLQSYYISSWNLVVGQHSILFWINEGLMTIFFLLIGLELEREVYHGELADIKNAALPIFAAIGGMLVPAAIFIAVNAGKPSQAGAGIPMATDIAFAIGILSLLGKRVPSSLKIFLTALAVIDDLGAILVIAIFYSASVIFLNLVIALLVFGILLLMNRFNICNLFYYLTGGIVMWYFMSQSGIHPTLTGVMLAFAIPFRKGDEKSPSYILQHRLHNLVAFFIMPLFALANTSIVIGNNALSSLIQPVSLGIIAGLVIGKPLGIVLFSRIGAAIGIYTLPPGIKWMNLAGTGFLAGIGFTMSIFITMLAFNDPDLVNTSKIAILAASIIAALTGLILLKITLKNN